MAVRAFVGTLSFWLAVTWILQGSAATGGPAGFGSAAEAARAPLTLPAEIPSVQRVGLQEVVDRAVVSTRAEAEPYAARAEVFEYLLNHPEFATHVTRTLKLARFRIWQTAEGLALDDGWGTKGDFALMYAGAGRRVFYARGRYEQRLLPDISGQAVVTIEYAFRPDGAGRTVVATAVSGHVALDSRLLTLVGRLLGPLAQRKADREARSLLKLFATVSRTIDERPDWVYEQLSRHAEVPRRDLEEFGRLLHQR